MERKLDNSPPTSLIEIIGIFGKDGEFHKDVSKLSDSIESLVITLGKKSGKTKEEDKPPRTLSGDWKDFTQELKRSLFDNPKQYLGMKNNVKKKENEDLKKEASEKGSIKENSVDTKDTSKIVDKDHSSTVLSDMVDVLKLIKEDKTQLKIYEDIVELKKTIKNLNDITAKTIEPNDEAVKQEDREKLAEAIARRLSDVIGESGGFGPDGGIPDKSGKKDKTSKSPGGGGGSGGNGGKIIGGAAAVSRVAGPAGVAVLIASAVDELAGLLGVNDDAEGKKLKEYPQELDDIQEKQVELIDPFYSKVGTFARYQEKFHSFIGLNETQQAEKRLRVETEFVIINEGIKNLEKNKDLTADQKKSLLELEAKRQALLPKKAPPEVKKAPPEVKKAPPSPAQLKEIEAAKAEEDLAREATAKLKNKNSNNEVKPVAAVAAAPVDDELDQIKAKTAAADEKLAQIKAKLAEAEDKLAQMPAKVESKSSAESEPFYKVPAMPEDAGQIETNSNSGGMLKELDRLEYNPVAPKPGIDANSDKLSRLSEENFDLSQSNNDSSQASPLVMSSNKTINNRETTSLGEKITPYPTYATFDRWQDKRSWGYDHV
jgi:hypothetical protein